MKIKSISIVPRYPDRTITRRVIGTKVIEFEGGPPYEVDEKCFPFLETYFKKGKKMKKPDSGSQGSNQSQGKTDSNQGNGNTQPPKEKEETGGN